MPNGFIRLDAATTKSARGRLIPVSKNLRAWILPHAKRSGAVWPENGRKLHEAARLAAGFGTPRQVAEASEEGRDLKVWPSNALRHSYASYHLAYHENSDKLALYMGHTDTRIIFAHYRKLVTAAAAASFWTLKPDSDQIVVEMANAG